MTCDRSHPYNSSTRSVVFIPVLQREDRGLSGLHELFQSTQLVTELGFHPRKPDTRA